MKKLSYRLCVCVWAAVLCAGCVTKNTKSSTLERGIQSNSKAQNELDRTFQK